MTRGPCAAKVTGQVLTLDAALQDTVPALLALLEALPDDSPFLALDPPQRRQRTLEALKRVLLRESQVQPLLLVFEDLHWIDTETQALLDSLVESLPTARLLLLVNYRPEYQHGWGSKTYYTQLRLDPLAPASAEALLQALLGDDPSLAPLTPLLIARTEGNPFFLEESVRTLVETGVLVGERGCLSPDPGARRPCRSRPRCRRCWRRASTGCRRTRNTCSRPLRSSARRSPRRCSRPLRSCPRRPCSGASPTCRPRSSSTRRASSRALAYTFKHALTQEVAYNAVLLERRRSVHERAAQAIEGLFAERLPEHYHALAHHYSRSGNTAKAVDYLHRAGHQAVERSAYAEAVSHLTTALDLLTTLPETPRAQPAGAGRADDPRHGVEGDQGPGGPRGGTAVHPRPRAV